MYFDVIFPMQLSEFIKLVNFGSNLKKICIKKPKNWYILIDLNSKSEFKISISVESYDKKNLLKIDEMATLPKSKISISNLDSSN